MSRRQIHYRREDMRVVRETVGENGERIIVRAYPDGTTVESHIPYRTPEEEARRDANIQKAVSQFARAMIRLNGYEWARERLEVIQ